MSIVKMKKLRLIAVRPQKDALMKELMLLGCVQVREPEGMLADPDTAALLHTETTNLVEARNNAAELETGLKLLNQYAPVKTPLLSSRPMVARSAVLDESALQADIALARRLKELDERIRRINADQSSGRATVESLRPWTALDYPLESPGTKTCAVIFGSLPAAVPLDRVADSLEAAAEEAQIIHVSSDETQHCFLLICLKEEQEKALEVLQTFGFSQVSFPGLKGTAKQNIAALEQNARKLDRQKKELITRIAAEKSGRGELRLGLDRMALVIARAEAAERLRGTGSIVAMEGWCPARCANKLTALLAKFDCAWELSDPKPEEYPIVPVQLKNNKIAEPLNMVTNMYSLPAYDGVDPNPLMAPFFILFYGIMMSDMGYGLLMMIASIVVLRKVKPKAGAHDFAALLGLCGISTFVVGAITGSFFGDFIPQVAKLINPNTAITSLPHLFTPLENTMSILIGSLCLGFIQVITGMAVSAVKKCRDGEALSAVFGEVAWWIIFLGAALMVLHIGSVGGIPVVLCIGALDLVVGQFVMKKNIIGALGGLFGAVYSGVTGILSDVLSYSRLMALMLAGSIISTVFNTLGAVTGNIIVFVLISLFGNTLNFALNLLGCFVHDLRLQCLEFFGRFYKDGGKPYRPLSMNTKYVDIIKEEI
jgi:V/A-type H+-transporting ATPase subunit I